jgi:hypothetical protein
LPALLTALQLGSFQFPSPSSTTDFYLERCAGLVNGSATLAKGLSQLPQAQPLLIVYQQSDPEGSLLAMILCYLDWPYSPTMLAIDQHPMSHTMVQNMAGSGTLYCGVGVPPGTTGTALGDNLIFVARGND